MEIAAFALALCGTVALCALLLAVAGACLTGLAFVVRAWWRS